MFSPLSALGLLMVPATALGDLGVREHEFVFTSSTPLKSVTVAGTFNGWNKTADRLIADADGRTWRLRRDLPFGVIQYKFVLNDQSWVIDPNAARQFDDGAGNTNSVLVHKPADYAQASRFGDGQITRSLLGHQPRIPEFNYDRGNITLTFRVRPQDVDAVEVVLNGKTHPLARVSADDLVEIRQVRLPWNKQSPLRYSFRLRDGQTTLLYGSRGLQRENPGQFEIRPQDVQVFEVPGWVQDAVFYQIFPDRFANGDKTNDPADVQPWDAKPTYWNFKGGDAAGLQQNIPYLRNLGISAIYFNPLFASPANHRYETSDYKRIDPRFGTNRDFVFTVQALRKNGIRTILDGVFNHTAVDFPAFADLLKNQQNSKFQSWYFVREWPVAVRENPPYEAWYGYRSMPKVNLDLPEARNYMLDLVDFWENEAQVDGWRLDVANEVSMEFWRAFRERVKAKGDDKWIVGEHWGNSGPWLQGDQWDSAMNYPFRDVLLRHFAENRTTSTRFLDDLFGVYHLYVPQVSRNMLNFLSTHDTPRFVTLAGGDARLHHLAATLMFTWVGAPCVYYGDELGMEGAADPDNRRGMRWDLNRPDNATLRHYQQLIAIRRDHIALRQGDPVRVYANNAQKTVAFARVLGNEAALVLVNRSEKPQSVAIPLSSSLRKVLAQPFNDALTGRETSPDRDGTIRWTLAPLSAAILVPNRQSNSSPEHRNPLQ